MALPEDIQALTEPLADGAMWTDGMWLKRLCAALLKDRARFDPTDFDETPTDNGRWLSLSSGGALKAYVVVEVTNPDGSITYDTRVCEIRGSIIATEPTE